MAYWDPLYEEEKGIDISMQESVALMPFAIFEDDAQDVPAEAPVPAEAEAFAAASAPYQPPAADLFAAAPTAPSPDIFASPAVAPSAGIPADLTFGGFDLAAKPAGPDAPQPVVERVVAAQPAPLEPTPAPVPTAAPQPVAAAPIVASAPLASFENDRAAAAPAAAPAATGPRRPVAPLTAQELDEQLLTIENGEDQLAISKALEDEVNDWIGEQQAYTGIEPDESAIKARIASLVAGRTTPTLSAGRLAVNAYRRLRGLFGLEYLLSDGKVSDIAINAFDSVFVERAGSGFGRVHLFTEPSEIEALVGRMNTRFPDLANMNLTTERPTYNGRFELVPGSRMFTRLNVIRPELASNNQFLLSMRKPTDTPADKIEFWAQPLADFNLDPASAGLSVEAARFLYECFRAKANILVVGGTGSGKTTLMKALIRAIPKNDRVLLAEEANELVMPTNAPNNAAMSSALGKTISDLLAEAMRMRPDRIIIGECRKPGEVMGFIEAINTGHDGSITTTHASSAKDGLFRLLTLASMDGDNKSSLPQIAQLIMSGLDIIIFITTYPLLDARGIRERRRRVLEIATIDRTAKPDKGNTVDFVLEYPFARVSNLDATDERRDIAKPLLCLGRSGVSGSFIDTMLQKGLTIEQIDALLPRSPELLANDQAKGQFGGGSY